jgi:hypothetical protein
MLLKEKKTSTTQSDLSQSFDEQENEDINMDSDNEEAMMDNEQSEGENNQSLSQIRRTTQSSVVINSVSGSLNMSTPALSLSKVKKNDAIASNVSKTTPQQKRG